MVSPRTLFGDEGDVLYERQFQLLLSSIPPVAVGVALVSPILESLTGPFGVSSTAIGQIVAVFVAPGIVVIPVSGLLADRYGRKPLVVFGLVLFGIAGTAIALTNEFRIALILRFLQGLGWATLTPVIITALGDLYSGTREETAQGIRFTTVGIAQAAVPPVAGFLVFFGWQYPFLLYASAIPIGLAVWIWFEEPTSIGSTARDGELATGSTNGLNQLRSIASLVTQSRVLTVLIARQVPTFTWYAVLTYNSVIVVQVLGGSPSLAGTLIAASSMAKAGAAAQVGRMTAFFDRRFDILLIVHLLLGSGLVISGFAPSFLWVGVGFVGIGVGLGIAMSLYRSVVTSFAPEHLRGGIVSISETWGRVTAASAPILLGGVIVLLESTVGSAMAVRWTMAGAGIVPGVIAVAALVIANRSPAVTSEQTLD